jgi:peptide/nickel transport system permease protein
MAPLSLNEEQRQLILEQYGLTQPLHIQYVRYMGNMLTGNMGVSIQHGSEVTPFLLKKMVNTIVITVPALIAAFLLGPVIGAHFAWNRGGIADKYGTGAVLAMWSAPVFWTGILAIMVFSLTLGWLPTGGMNSARFEANTMFGRIFSLDTLRHAILPLGVYFLWRLSQPALYMRNNMLETMKAEFITLKRAEGIPERDIRIKHAARNSMLPVLHYFALALGFAFGGSVVIETVFNWPGLGRAMWTAVTARDYPVAQGALFLISFMVISLNFVADIVSVYIDPRATEGEQ